VPPNSFALARTVEYFRISRDVLALCVGKSTYARCGIIVNVTPFERAAPATVRSPSGLPALRKSFSANKLGFKLMESDYSPR
jgi:hypothetical protein